MVLDLTADLRFRVEAPGGRSTAGTVTADGRTIRVDSAEPAVLVRAVGTSDRRRTAAIGATLQEAGVTVELTGPRGTFARFGSGVHSRLGRLTTGSEHVDVRGAVVATWRTQAPRVAVGAATLAALVVLVSRRARRG